MKALNLICEATRHLADMLTRRRSVHLLGGAVVIAASELVSLLARLLHWRNTKFVDGRLHELLTLNVRVALTELSRHSHWHTALLRDSLALGDR